MSLAWSEATRLAAKGGRADGLRRALIIGCAAVGAMLCAAAASIPSFWISPDAKRIDMDSGRASGHVDSMLGRLLSDRDLAPGVIFALLLLAVPVVHLMVQAVRVGAVDRDRRCAAMRSAGASAADVRAVVRAEALACSVLGAAMGVPLWYGVLAITPRLGQVDYASNEIGGEVMAGSMPVLAVITWPSPLLLCAAAALVPISAAVLVPFTARKVRVGTAEQAQQEREPGQLLALSFLAVFALAVLLVIGLVISAVTGHGGLSGPAVGLISMVLPLVAVALVVLTLAMAAPRMALRLGRWLSRREYPAAFLAGRMMQARPRLASSVAVSLVLVGFVGASTVVWGGFIEHAIVVDRITSGGYDYAPGGALTQDQLFYVVPTVLSQILAVLAAALGTIGLVVAVSEQVSLRGPQIARQVALGVSRTVLIRALVIEAAAPVVVMSTIAVLTGAAFPAALVLAFGEGSSLSSVHWERLLLLWVTLVGGAVFAAYLGSQSLKRSAHLRTIRDR